MRSVILVSPYFPPSMLAGVHRARLLATHLPVTGWNPIVLCVHEGFHEQRLDPDLASLLPPSLEIIKVPAMPARLTRTLGVGDIGLRAWRFLRTALFDLLRSRSVAAVFITGSPFYPMLMGPSVKQRFGTPIVLDFQDPWVSAWAATQPLQSKAGVSHQIARFLEPRALRCATYITSVSDIQNLQMKERYPWLDSSRMVGIPIGGDPDDFKRVHAIAPKLPGELLDPLRVNISYVGTFMPRSGPLIRVLLKGLRQLLATTPEFGNRIRLNFVGTSNQPDNASTFQVKSIAEAEGVAHCVFEVPERLPYMKAVAILERSDAILMIGSDEPHYTASKIYPGLMSGRPYLSIFHRKSSAHEVLSAAGGGLAFAFSDEHELGLLEHQVAHALRQLVLAPNTLGAPDPNAYRPFEAKFIAQRFADVFNAAANKSTDLNSSG